jgi:hypothetical protein
VGPRVGGVPTGRFGTLLRPSFGWSELRDKDLNSYLGSAIGVALHRPTHHDIKRTRHVKNTRQLVRHVQSQPTSSTHSVPIQTNGGARRRTNQHRTPQQQTPSIPNPHGRHAPLRARGCHLEPRPEAPDPCSLCACSLAELIWGSYPTCPNRSRCSRCSTHVSRTTITVFSAHHPLADGPPPRTATAAHHSHARRKRPRSQRTSPRRPTPTSRRRRRWRW